jgi:hypothetical protein
MQKTKTPTLIKTKIRFNKHKNLKSDLNKRFHIIAERAHNSKYLNLNKINTLNEYRTKIENKYYSNKEKENKLIAKNHMINENINYNNLNKNNEKKKIMPQIFNSSKQEMKEEKTSFPQKNNIIAHNMNDNGNINLSINNNNSRNECNIKKNFVKFSDLYSNGGNLKNDSERNSRYLRVNKRNNLKNEYNYSKNASSFKNYNTINSNISRMKINKTECDDRNEDILTISNEKEDLCAVSNLKKNRYLNLDNDNFYIPSNRSYEIINKVLVAPHDNLNKDNKTITASQNNKNKQKNKLLKIKTDDNSKKVYNTRLKTPITGIKKYILDFKKRMFECQTENAPNLTSGNEPINSYNEYLKQKKNLLYLKSRDYKIIENKMKEDLRIKNNLKSLSIRRNYKEKIRPIKITERNNIFKFIEARKQYNTINNSLEDQNVNNNIIFRTIDEDKNKDIFHLFGINI